MSTTWPADLPIPQWLISQRRGICERLSTAEGGHPKPELVAKLRAELDTFDKQHPRVRNAR